MYVCVFSLGQQSSNCVLCGSEDSWALGTLRHQLHNVEVCLGAHWWINNRGTLPYVENRMQKTIFLGRTIYYLMIKWPTWLCPLGHLGSPSEGNPWGHFSATRADAPVLSILHLGDTWNITKTSNPARPRGTWIVPSPWRIKIKVDGAFYRYGTTGAAVATCRDEHVTYLGSSSLVLRNIKEPVCI